MVGALGLARMTTTERDAISSPVDGMLIFNTSNDQIEEYNGSWQALTGGGAALTVEEGDGTPSVDNVDTIVFPNGTVTDDGGGQVTISLAGSGDVTASSNFGTDNVLIRSDGTGKGVQASGITISDADVVSEITQLNVDNLRLDGNTISSTDTNGNINLTPDGTGAIVIPNDVSLSFGGGTGNPTSLKTGSDSTFLFDTGANADIKFKGTAAGASDWGYTDDSFNYVFRSDSSGNTTQSGNATISGNIELGHASDTTLTRSAAGVLAVEGVVVPTISSTSTLTNKTIDGDSNTLSNLDIGNEVDWAAATDVADRSATPASGDKLLLFEAGVGLRKIDWDDLPSGGGGLDNVVEDTTPQLGGDLDAGGFDINNGGVIFLTEQADAEADVAGKGQIWVNTATPNELYFTDDAGTDFEVSLLTKTQALTNKTVNGLDFTENADGFTVTGGSSSERDLIVTGGDITLTGGATVADGELLIGDNGNNEFTKATLTEGTGISITNGAGTIEIATDGLTAGPVSSTDHAIARWDGTGGGTLQDSNVSIDDSGSISIPEAEGLKGGTASISDDSVYSFTPSTTTGAIVIYGNNTATQSANGIVAFRAVATVFTAAIAAGSDLAVTTGALTGTTGTDGKLTVSTHTDGKIYIENRMGATRAWTWVNFFSA